MFDGLNDTAVPTGPDARAGDFDPGSEKSGPSCARRHRAAPRPRDWRTSSSASAFSCSQRAALRDPATWAAAVHRAFQTATGENPTGSVELRPAGSCGTSGPSDARWDRGRFGPRDWRASSSAWAFSRAQRARGPSRGLSGRGIEICGGPLRPTRVAEWACGSSTVASEPVWVGGGGAGSVAALSWRGASGACAGTRSTLGQRVSSGRGMDICGGPLRPGRGGTWACGGPTMASGPTLIGGAEAGGVAVLSLTVASGPARVSGAGTGGVAVLSSGRHGTKRTGHRKKGGLKATASGPVSEVLSPSKPSRKKGFFSKH